MVKLLMYIHCVYRVFVFIFLIDTIIPYEVRRSFSGHFIS